MGLTPNVVRTIFIAEDLAQRIEQSMNFLANNGPLTTLLFLCGADVTQTLRYDYHLDTMPA